MLALANGTIALAQIDLAKTLNADEVVCLVEAVPNGVDVIEDYCMRLGMSFTLVRAVADISVRLASDDEVLLIADGLVASPAESARLQAERGTFLLVLDPGDRGGAMAERFERIDMNHLWAGIAVLRGSDLFEVRALPEDRNIQSATLRVAVQRIYRRIIWPTRLVETGQLAHPANAEEMAIVARAQSSENRAGGLLSAQIWGSPSGLSLAKRIWSKGWARPAMRAAAVLLPVAAAGLGLVGWPVMALVLLAAGRFVDSSMARLFGRFMAQRPSRNEHLVHLGVSGFAFLAILARGATGEHLVSVLFVGLVALALSAVLRTDNASERSAWIPWLASHGPFLAGAILAASAGWLLYWTMACAALALGDLVWRAARPKPLESA